METGYNTVFGRIADLVKAADHALTPLQRKMKAFVRTLPQSLATQLAIR